MAGRWTVVVFFGALGCALVAAAQTAPPASANPPPSEAAWPLDDRFDNSTAPLPPSPPPRDAAREGAGPLVDSVLNAPPAQNDVWDGAEHESGPAAQWNAANQGAQQQPGDNWRGDQPCNCDSCVAERGEGLTLREQLRRRFGHEGPRGVPLEQESWRNRPLSIGGFFGGLWPDHLLANRVTSGTGFLAGWRFGWDFADTCGVESRFGFTKFALQYPHDPLLVHDADIFMWDGSFLWYPWGNNQWRPFLTVGLGLTDIQWYNDLDQEDHDTLFMMPFGLGLKYRWDSRLAFRVEFLDNLAFGSGSGLNNLNNLSLTAGFELRLGGATRRSYWPWNPSRQWW